MELLSQYIMQLQRMQEEGKRWMPLLEALEIITIGQAAVSACGRFQIVCDRVGFLFSDDHRDVTNTVKTGHSKTQRLSTFTRKILPDQGYYTAMYQLSNRGV